MFVMTLSVQHVPGVLLVILNDKCFVGASLSMDKLSLFLSMNYTMGEKGVIFMFIFFISCIFASWLKILLLLISEGNFIWWPLVSFITDRILNMLLKRHLIWDADYVLFIPSAASSEPSEIKYTSLTVMEPLFFSYNVMTFISGDVTEIVQCLTSIDIWFEAFAAT